jgi:hypothetical protein
MPAVPEQACSGRFDESHGTGPSLACRKAEAGVRTRAGRCEVTWTGVGRVPPKLSCRDGRPRWRGGIPSGARRRRPVTAPDHRAYLVQDLGLRRSGVGVDDLDKERIVVQAQTPAVVGVLVNVVHRLGGHQQDLIGTLGQVPTVEDVRHIRRAVDAKVSRATSAEHSPYAAEYRLGRRGTRAGFSGCRLLGGSVA